MTCPSFVCRWFVAIKGHVAIRSIFSIHDSNIKWSFIRKIYMYSLSEIIFGVRQGCVYMPKLSIFNPYPNNIFLDLHMKTITIHIFALICLIVWHGLMSNWLENSSNDKWCPPRLHFLTKSRCFKHSTIMIVFRVDSYNI